jgi:hypothetical protein
MARSLEFNGSEWTKWHKRCLEYSGRKLFWSDIEINSIYNVKLRLSGMSSVEYLELSSVSANIAFAIIRVGTETVKSCEEYIEMSNV